MSNKGTKPPKAGALVERAALEAFCREHLKAGRHFGTIHRRNCAKDGENNWEPCGTCNAKPSLRKEGSERICEFKNALIGKPELEREMIAAVGGQGWVALSITLFDKDTGNPIGHGIGAYKSTDPNLMVKFAKKNALTDAVKSAWALSDLFDDGEGSDEQTSAPPPAPPAPAKRATPGRAAAPAAAKPTPAPAAPSAAPTPPGPSTVEPGKSFPNGPSAPAELPPMARRPAPGGSSEEPPPPSWWKVRAEFPNARWTVLDKDDAEYGIVGVIHFTPDKAPECGGRQKWSPFKPNAQGKPEFKNKSPFTDWSQLNWRELLEWSIKHRLMRKDGDETNSYNDPFHHLLADKFTCVYDRVVKPIAEHAAAMDYVAWGVTRKNGGVLPEWAVAALDGAAPPAAAPAPEPEPERDPMPAPDPSGETAGFNFDDDVPF